MDRKKWGNVLLAAGLINILPMIWAIINFIFNFTPTSTTKHIFIIVTFISLMALIVSLYFITKIDIQKIKDDNKHLFERKNNNDGI